MNRAELLTLGMGEEGSEVSQMASKILRFGLFEVFPGQALTNAQRTHLELDDLNAMVELMNEELGFGYIPCRANIEAKKAKFNRYADYSKVLGCVTK